VRSVNAFFDSFPSGRRQSKRKRADSYAQRAPPGPAPHTPFSLSEKRRHALSGGPWQRIPLGNNRYRRIATQIHFQCLPKPVRLLIWIFFCSAHTATRPAIAADFPCWCREWVSRPPCSACCGAAYQEAAKHVLRSPQVEYWPPHRRMAVGQLTNLPKKEI
jgi:hypothetical protein